MSISREDIATFKKNPFEFYDGVKKKNLYMMNDTNYKTINDKYNKALDKKAYISGLPDEQKLKLFFYARNSTKKSSYNKYKYNLLIPLLVNTYIKDKKNDVKLEQIERRLNKLDFDKKIKIAEENGVFKDFIASVDKFYYYNDCGSKYLKKLIRQYIVLNINNFNDNQHSLIAFANDERMKKAILGEAEDMKGNYKNHVVGYYKQEKELKVDLVDSDLKSLGYEGYVYFNDRQDCVGAIFFSLVLSILNCTDDVFKQKWLNELISVFQNFKTEYEKSSSSIFGRMKSIVKKNNKTIEFFNDIISFFDWCLSNKYDKSHLFEYYLAHCDGIGPFLEKKLEGEKTILDKIKGLSRLLGCSSCVVFNIQNGEYMRDQYDIESDVILPDLNALLIDGIYVGLVENLPRNVSVPVISTPTASKKKSKNNIKARMRADLTIPISAPSVLTSSSAASSSAKNSSSASTASGSSKNSSYPGDPSQSKQPLKSSISSQNSTVSLESSPKISLFSSSISKSSSIPVAKASALLNNKNTLRAKLLSLVSNKNKNLKNKYNKISTNLFKNKNNKNAIYNILKNNNNKNENRIDILKELIQIRITEKEKERNKMMEDKDIATPAFKRAVSAINRNINSGKEYTNIKESDGLKSYMTMTKGTDAEGYIFKYYKIASEIKKLKDVLVYLDTKKSIRVRTNIGVEKTITSGKSTPVSQPKPPPGPPLGKPPTALSVISSSNNNEQPKTPPPPVPKFSVSSNNEYNNRPEVPPPKPPSGNSNTKSSQDFSKYEDMIKQGTRNIHVKSRMKVNGISNNNIKTFINKHFGEEKPKNEGSASIISKNPPRPPPGPPPSKKNVKPGPDAKPPLDPNDPFYKYHKMKTMLPEGAVRQKMMTNGFSNAEIEAFFEGKPVNLSGKPPAKNPIQSGINLKPASERVLDEKQKSMTELMAERLRKTRQNVSEKHNSNSNSSKKNPKKNPFENLLAKGRALGSSGSNNNSNSEFKYP
jgi:hypothetical protein